MTLTDLTINADIDEGADGVEFRRLGFSGVMDGIRNMRCLERLQIPFVSPVGSAKCRIARDTLGRCAAVYASTSHYYAKTWNVGLLYQS